MMTGTGNVLLSVYSCPKPTNVFAFGTTTTTATATNMNNNINNSIASPSSYHHHHHHLHVPICCTILAKWWWFLLHFVRSFIQSFILYIYEYGSMIIRVLYINIYLYLFEMEWNGMNRVLNSIPFSETSRNKNVFHQHNVHSSIHFTILFISIPCFPHISILRL